MTGIAAVKSRLAAIWFIPTHPEGVSTAGLLGMRIRCSQTLSQAMPELLGGIDQYAQFPSFSLPEVLRRVAVMRDIQAGRAALRGPKPTRPS